MTTIEELQALFAADFSATLGIEIVAAGPDELVLRYAFRPGHRNANGVLHGSVMHALADSGMGAVVQAGLGPGRRCAAAEVQLRYFRPVRSGRLEARCRVVHRGRRLIRAAAELLDGQGERVAASAGSFVVLAE